ERDAERGRRERLLTLLEQATGYYERCLWDSVAGGPTRAYLSGRGLGEEICREYRLGLAPGGHSLSHKAREKGFSVEELRAAGLEPVGASMGPARTGQQLRELSRLGRRVWLCFDSDAAGEDATLRGMEAAVAAGFEVKVVALEAGTDPAEAPEGFEERLGTA